jgi:signal peptidase I
MNEPRQKLSEAVKDLLRQGHSVELSAYGHSMIPFLRPGQKVQLAPVDMSQIVRGDIVAFQKADYLVIHRVHEVSFTDGQLFLRTKGDSNLNPDVLIDAQVYLAKVIAVQHGKSFHAVSPRTISAKLPLRLGRFYSMPFWLWKHVINKSRITSH